MKYSQVRVAHPGSSAEQSIHLYPNPTSGSLTLQSSNMDTENILIFDALGNNVTSKVQVANDSNSQAELNVSLFEPGIYLIKTSNASSRFVKR